MTYLEKFTGHLKTILKHKWFVFKHCCKAGIIWRGIIHDMSKFSPIEFFESVEYYQGTSSPIDACKKANNGLCKAWLHHKGRNSHHYEYWVDSLDTGGKAMIMPYEDSIEAICDYIGAGEAYSGKSGKELYDSEFEWW